MRYRNRQELAAPSLNATRSSNKAEGCTVAIRQSVGTGILVRRVDDPVEHRDAWKRR